MLILGTARCLISQVTNITLQIINLLLIGFDKLNHVLSWSFCHNQFSQKVLPRAHEILWPRKLTFFFVKTNSVGSVWRDIVGKRAQDLASSRARGRLDWSWNKNIYQLRLLLHSWVTLTEIYKGAGFFDTCHFQATNMSNNLLYSTNVTCVDQVKTFSHISVYSTGSLGVFVCE